MTTQTYDVIGAEVHRKALENVAKEMAISLVRTSGSPVVVESKDYSTCVMDTVPEHLSIGMTTIPHIGSSLVGTRAVTAIAEQGEIEPGAGWIVNDPHTGGALHQADISIIMPTFFGDEHVGWSFVNTHILDIGGSGISGFAPGATDIYQEGLLFPAARVISDGAIEPAWRRFIAANVRTPAPVLNDLRSMIAANNTAARKIEEIVGRYGLEGHRELCELNKAQTEALLRERIAALPDGVYEAVDWNELRRGADDERLLELRIKLEVDGSDARFSFTGAPQVDAFVNGTRGVMLGWLAGEVARVLGYGDLPLNGGFWRPIHVDLGDPGTIVNSLPPAPVSNGHAAIGCRVAQLTRDVLSQAAALSDDPRLRARVAGRVVDSCPMAAWFGTNQHGTVSVMFYVDPAIGIGGAAQPTHDGPETFGIGQALGGGIADIETHEALDPLLFLWRRLVPDTGAPGQTRGGLGMEQAYTVRYADGAAGPVWNHGLEVPAAGAGGGLPAPPGIMRLLRDSNVEQLIAAHEMPSRSRIAGVEDDEMPALVARETLARGDVFVARSGGGAGLGDPLLREPGLVATDVADGWVSAEQARVVYGVELDADGGVDVAATVARRDEVRRERIGHEPRQALRPPESPGVAVRADGGAWVCGHCGEQLAPVADNWREGAAVERVTPAAERLAEWGMQLRMRRQDPQIVLREYMCPSCAALLSVDVSTDRLPPHPAPLLSVAEAG